MPKKKFPADLTGIFACVEKIFDISQRHVDFYPEKNLPADLTGIFDCVEKIFDISRRRIDFCDEKFFYCNKLSTAEEF